MADKIHVIEVSPQGRDGVGSAPDWATLRADMTALKDEVPRLTDLKDLMLEPEVNGGALFVDAPVWETGRASRDGEIDGLFYVKNWVNKTGQPWQSGVYGSYAKAFGVHATKQGQGNLDAHWASLQHEGNDEVGLFIGDATSKKGGNAWGGHFWVSNQTTESVLIGHSIELVKNAATPVSKTATTIATAASAGAATITTAAKPVPGRYLVGTGSSQEFVSILSVTASAPWVCTLANPLNFAKTVGNAVTPYHGYSRGLHLVSSGTHDPDMAILIDRSGAGKWGDVLLYLDGSGPSVRTRIVGNKASVTEIIPTLDGGIIATSMRVDSRIDSTAARMQIVGPNGQDKSLTFYTGDTARWSLAVSGSDVGGNAGTDINFFAHDDAGGTRHAVFASDRVTGVLYATQGVRIRQKAGAPTDADFSGLNPGAGTMVFDTTNNRLYIRGSSGWRYVATTV